MIYMWTLCANLSEHVFKYFLGEEKKKKKKDNLVIKKRAKLINISLGYQKKNEKQFDFLNSFDVVKNNVLLHPHSETYKSEKCSSSK